MLVESKKIVMSIYHF